jgi:hypothetical protein
MREQPRVQGMGWIPLVAGIAWLWAGVSVGLLGLLLCLVPGIPLMATGGSKLLWPGDPRIQQFAALGGLLGVLVAIPGLFFIGVSSSLLLAILSAASFVVAGLVSVRQEPHFESVPEPRPSLSLYAQVAVDDALLATMQIGMKVPTGKQAGLVEREVRDARALYQAQAWLEKPASYHREPPPLEAPRIRDREVRLRGGRIQYEHLSFESGYEPHAEEPGRDRWLSYERNPSASRRCDVHAERQCERSPPSQILPWQSGFFVAWGYRPGRHLSQRRAPRAQPSSASKNRPKTSIRRPRIIGIRPSDPPQANAPPGPEGTPSRANREPAESRVAAQAEGP